MEGLCVILGLIQILSTMGSGGVFDCRTECFGKYNLSQVENPATSCDAVNEVLDCFEQNQPSCDSTLIVLLLGKVFENYEALNCSVNATAAPTVMGPKCPSLSDVYNSNPSVPMGRPEIEPAADLPTLCTMPHSSTSLSQCSLFMDSQLRAFSSYRGGLETCSIPGKWYLLQHSSLIVEVEGMNLEPGSDQTRLTKINVTFYAHSCNMVARSYVAQVSSTLPSDFIPPIAVMSTTTATRLAVPSASALQLVSNSNGSVVTLLATWLNTIIIIRQYANFLSITIQVPDEISYESQGLCTGCPPHMYINITHFNDQVRSTCNADNNRASENCIRHAGVANRGNLVYVNNNSYLDACVYSMYKSGNSSEVLSMFNAIADDATLLVNVGNPPTTQMTTNPQTFPSQTQTSPTVNTSTVSSSRFLFPSPLLILLLQSSSLLYRWQHT